MKHKKILRAFWEEHYMVEANGVPGYCCLCGNTGIINTISTARTLDDEWIGKKVFCLCPNGRSGLQRKQREVYEKSKK